MFPAVLEYSNALAEGAVDYLETATGLTVVVANFEKASPLNLPEGPLPFDGILTWANAQDDTVWFRKLLSQTPNIVNCGSDWITEGVPSVCLDAQGLTRAAARHLLERSPKQIGMVGHETSLRPSQSLRRDSMHQRVRAAGVEFVELELTGDHVGDSPWILLDPPEQPDLARFLSGLTFPAGLWCEDDHVAVLVSRVARELGIKIPRQLAILGTGNYLVGRFAEQPISTIPLPGRLVGREAMQLLDAMLDGRPKPAEPILIPPMPIIVRQSTDDRAGEDASLRRAYERIQEHAADGLTVKQLVRYQDSSQVTFTRRFREAFGRTPGAEIRHVRLEHAKTLLERTDLPITRIASVCGFAKVSPFNVFFKRETGQAPSEYRASSRRKRTTAGK
jgi:LacI family transcriptional regulator